MGRSRPGTAGPARALGVHEMAELTVGQRVRVRPKVGQVEEGVVFTHDHLTNTITIKQDIVPKTKTHSTILVFNRAYVEVDVLARGASVVDDRVTLPNVR